MSHPVAPEPPALSSTPDDDVPVRPRSRFLRVATVVVLAVFALVTVVTSMVSIGSYCLTTDGADTREIPAPHRLPTPGSD